MYTAIQSELTVCISDEAEVVRSGCQGHGVITVIVAVVCVDVVGVAVLVLVAVLLAALFLVAFTNNNL